MQPINVINGRWKEGVEPKVTNLTGTAFMEEAGAHVFHITAQNADGTAAAFTGTVTALFLRADDTTVALDGTITDGAAEVTLVSDCYHVPGRFSIAVYVTGENEVSTCVYAAVGNVYRTSSDNTIDSGAAIPTLAQLEAAYQNCVQATYDADAVVGGAAVTQSSTENNVDLDISDPTGNVLARLSGGNLETKGFKSWYIRQMMGDKWACIGDSLTEVNSKTSLHYHDYIAQETGITVVNLGYSGAGYAKQGGAGKNFTDIVPEIPNDTNVITIFGSGNDLASGLDLGEITDTGTTTICGCINTTLTAIYAAHPVTPLGIITPTPWAYQEPSSVNTGMQNYCAALVQIAARRGIPCLDLYHESLLHPTDTNFRPLAYSHDDGEGVHPDETGHALIAPRIRQFLFTLI